MKKNTILVIFLILLMVSTVSAGLLDEAKKSQERRKLELNNYQSASSFSSGTNSIFYNPYIPKEKGYSTDNELPFIKKEKVEKTDGKNVMKPGEKLNLGNHILIISKTLSFETKITDQGKEMDFGYFKLITQGEIPFEEDQNKQVKKGFLEKLRGKSITSPTGAITRESKEKPKILEKLKALFKR